MITSEFESLFRDRRRRLRSSSIRTRPRQIGYWAHLAPSLDAIPKQIPNWFWNWWAENWKRYSSACSVRLIRQSPSLCENCTACSFFSARQNFQCSSWLVLGAISCWATPPAPNRPLLAQLISQLADLKIQDSRAAGGYSCF